MTALLKHKVLNVCPSACDQMLQGDKIYQGFQRNIQENLGNATTNDTAQRDVGTSQLVLAKA